MPQPEYKQLLLNSRMYQYIRSSTIVNLDDALVELITNSVDAYNEINNNPNLITINFSKQNNYIEVIDQATGLNASQMNVCFLEVGTYTSNDFKRGHFSRGAKDISALGDCTFIAIQDGTYSVCKILYEGLGAMLVMDCPVTDEIRNNAAIKNNGLYVKLEIKMVDIINNFDPSCFSYHYSLRDILSSDKYNIVFNDVDNNTQNILKYTFPEAETVIDGEYLVPEFNVISKFTLYLSKDNNIKYSNDNRYTENGIIISSNNTIYENRFLNTKYIGNNPHSRKIFGRISCDYINSLLKDYETNGPSINNPFPIIDPSRLQGINYRHPFIRNLIILPIERINYILTQLEYEIKNKINQEDINKLFDIEELHLINDDIFKQLGIKLDTDFKLKKIEMVPVKLNKIRQSFVRENLNLKYSKPNINIQQEALKQQYYKTETARLSINFIDSPIIGKYQVYATNKGVTINISKSNYIIKKYVLEKNDNNNIQFRAHVADIISEALSDLLTNVELSNQDITNIDQTTLFDLMNNIFNKHYTNISEKIHSIILD